MLLQDIGRFRSVLLIALVWLRFSCTPQSVICAPARRNAHTSGHRHSVPRRGHSQRARTPAWRDPPIARSDRIRGRRASCAAHSGPWLDCSPGPSHERWHRRRGRARLRGLTIRSGPRPAASSLGDPSSSCVRQDLLTEQASANVRGRACAAMPGRSVVRGASRARLPLPPAHARTPGHARTPEHAHTPAHGRTPAHARHSGAPVWRGAAWFQAAAVRDETRASGISHPCQQDPARYCRARRNPCKRLRSTVTCIPRCRTSRR